VGAILVSLLAVSLAAAAVPGAKDLFKEGQKAERSGDIVRAYLLYSQAAALDPANPDYWARSLALRTRASLKARPRPLPAVENPSSEPEPEPEPPPAGFSTEISDEDLTELRRLLPPPELKPTGGARNLDLRGDPKALYQQIARMWGLDTVFDGDYPAGGQVRLRLDETDFTGAIRALDEATSSFTFALGEKLMFVAKDTPQKRRDMEPTIAVSIPLLDTVTPQEAQELGRAVQQSLDIVKLSVDGTRRMVLIRDRISKVRPAQIIFEQLAIGRAQVAIEVQFLEIDRSAMMSYGFLLPNQFPIFHLGSDVSRGALQSLARVFMGRTILGIGIADAEIFATMNRSHSKTLLHSMLRGTDGEPVTFHVGDKYPVATGGLLGGSILGLPPQFNFEDLGLSLKITPQVHGLEEITLEVQAEFKVLAGQSLNGIPVISNRKFDSKVRLKGGEWGIATGVMSTTEARNITGIPGLSQIPALGHLFRHTQTDRTSTEVVLLFKPRVVTLPASEIVTRGVWVGSETRMKIPI
jgi:general secretion pathway protein D